MCFVSSFAAFVVTKNEKVNGNRSCFIIYDYFLLQCPFVFLPTTNVTYFCLILVSNSFGEREKRKLIQFSQILRERMFWFRVSTTGTVVKSELFVLEKCFAKNLFSFSPIL